MTVVTATENNLCRDCAHIWQSERPVKICIKCRSRRVIFHNELAKLTIAHIDCDSFYATVEKRDNPNIANKPVAVGGGKRGVVAAACYIARMYGVKSAMPMFKALKTCPDLIVIRPNMEKYSKAGLEIRALMDDTTPVVEPISIDEAFLDLTGTQRLHHATAAQTLVKLIKRIEEQVGITASVGLSHNKFLAKIASDLEKPKGFSVIGKAETLSFLYDKPVSIIWGVGKVLNRKLNQDGIYTVGELREVDQTTLMKRYGTMGQHLYDYSRGDDKRKIDNTSLTKSISSETTFNEDINDYEILCNELWPLCEKVSKGLKQKKYAGRSLSLKLKSADFKQITRSLTLPDPTQLAEKIYRTGKMLLKKEATGTSYRLIGIGLSELCDPALADPLDLADPDAQQRATLERVMDDIRKKLGDGAVKKGRSL